MSLSAHFTDWETEDPFPSQWPFCARRWAEHPAVSMKESAPCFRQLKLEGGNLGGLHFLRRPRSAQGMLGNVVKAPQLLPRPVPLASLPEFPIAYPYPQQP